MHPDILGYHQQLAATDQAICEALHEAICRALPDAENKIWHAHPVWFLDGNPITGYSKLKDSVRLLFWSGQSFDEPGLQTGRKNSRRQKKIYRSRSDRYRRADQMAGKVQGHSVGLQEYCETKRQAGTSSLKDL